MVQWDWFGYFHYSHCTRFPRWTVMSAAASAPSCANAPVGPKGQDIRHSDIRKVPRPDSLRPGARRLDYQGWRNHYFDELGVFSVTHAHRSVCQSP